MAKETAEQKLLKLIEATNAQQPSDAPQPSAASSALEARKVFDSVRGTGGGGALAASQFVESFQNLLSVFFSGKFDFRSFGIKEANLALTTVIVFVAVGFGLSLNQNMRTSQNSIEFPALQSAPFSAQGILPLLGDVAEYVSSVSIRNIFQPYEEKVVAEKEIVPAEILGVQKVIDRTKDLKLVGISWLDTADSASAMVENTGSGMTYFLRSGDKINEVTVTSIYADSIVVEFQGEQLEIRL